MAVVSVNPVWQGRDCDEQEDGTRSYTRVWRVVLAYSTDSPAEAKAAVGIAKWAPYVDTSGFVDLQARAKSIRVSSDGEMPNIYLVTVNYDTRMDMPNRDSGGATGKGGANSERNAPEFREQDNPLLQPWQISGGAEKRKEVVSAAPRMTSDNPGAGVLKESESPRNTVGNPFVPALEEDRCDETLTIQRNVITLPAVREYINTINASSWRGQDQWTVKFVDRQWSRKWHQVCGFYYEETYTFAVRYPSWIRKVLNAGTTAWDDDLNEEVAILDPYGQPITEPVCLDADGLPLGKNDAPVYVYYRTLSPKDWSLLGLEAQ